MDIIESNVIEVVRDIKSTECNTSGDFKTFAIDCGGTSKLSVLRVSELLSAVIWIGQMFFIRRWGPLLLKKSKCKKALTLKGV